LNLSTHADVDLAEYIQAKMTGVSNAKPPFVFYYSHYLGDGSVIQEMYQNGRLQNLISGNIVQDLSTQDKSSDFPIVITSDPIPQLRFIDSILQVGESVASYLNPFTWWSSSAPMNKDMLLLTVDVIHTNWYGRNLNRTFTFYENYFQRIHPNGQIRANHYYNQVHSLTRKGHLLVIEYNEGISPDWIQATSNQIKDIIDLIEKRKSLQ